MIDRRRLLQRGALLAGAAALAPRLSVAAQSDTATPPAATPIVPVDISTLPLKNEGKLTIHADQPLYEPWFIDNDPTNGKGFEGALAYAIGERLGFTREQIEWGYTSFNTSYAPGPKEFDFYMTEVSITDVRAEVVDFSDPYYQSPLVIVTKKDSPVLQAKTLAELAEFKFGTQIGTVYHTYLVETVKPKQDPLVYDTNADSLQALENGQVDAVIENLEIGIFNTTIQFDDLAMGGLLPGNPGKGMGLVFEKGSELVPYVNSALASVIADGTRDKIAEEWLPKTDNLITYS
jgi:polar amino acid transport system substrate-binding protein